MPGAGDVTSLRCELCEGLSRTANFRPRSRTPSLVRGLNWCLPRSPPPCPRRGIFTRCGPGRELGQSSGLREAGLQRVCVCRAKRRARWVLSPAWKQPGRGCAEQRRSWGEGKSTGQPAASLVGGFHVWRKSVGSKRGRRNCFTGTCGRCLPGPARQLPPRPQTGPRLQGDVQEPARDPCPSQAATSRLVLLLRFQRVRTALPVPV